MERAESITNSSQTSRVPSSIRAQSIASQKSGCWYCLSNLDIFKYLPVPITNEVSSRSSQTATLFAILIIFGLFVFQMVILYKDNQPRVNSNSQSIDKNAVYTVPEFGFGFFVGESLENHFDDDTYFEYSVEQYKQQKDNQNKYYVVETKQELINCDPEWISLSVQLQCPKDKLSIKNYITQNEDVMYPKFRILECDKKKQIALGKQCKSQEEVDSLLSKGRLLLFLKKEGQKNAITGKFSADSYIMFQFFITRNLYNRAETILGRYLQISKPDYATRFREGQSTYTYIKNNNQYVSNVNIFFKENQKRILNPFNDNDNYQGGLNEIQNQIIQEDDRNCIKDCSNQYRQLQSTSSSSQKPYFQWWITQDKKVDVVQLTYKTVPDVLSFLGGLWGVINAVFVFIFLRRNAEKFYSKRKVWKNFEIIIDTQNVTEDLIKTSKQNPQQNFIELQFSDKANKQTNPPSLTSQQLQNLVLTYNINSDDNNYNNNNSEIFNNEDQL